MVFPYQCEGGMTRNGVAYSTCMTSDKLIDPSGCETLSLTPPLPDETLSTTPSVSVVASVSALPLASTALTLKLYLPAGATVVPSSSTPSQVSGCVPAVVAPRSMVLTTLPLLSVILILASAAAVPRLTPNTAAVLEVGAPLLSVPVLVASCMVEPAASTPWLISPAACSDSLLW